MSKMREALKKTWLRPVVLRMRRLPLVKKCKKLRKSWKKRLRKFLGKLRNSLKKTWLRPVVLWIRRLPPVKKLKKQISRSRKWYLMKKVLPREFAKYSNLPIDENKVIFVEHRLPYLSNSFTYLYDKLAAETDYDLHIHYLRSAFVSYRQFTKNCKKLYKDMATAKYIFVSETIDVMGSFDRREGQKMVQLWHACGAFKRFGMSTGDMIFGMSTADQRRYPGNKNYTCVTVSSPDVMWAYEEALDMKDRPQLIKPLGTSRTDIFYEKETVDTAFEHLYELFPAAKGKKIILFAPTFRGRVRSAKTAELFDPDLFYEAFKDEYVLIMKHHPMVRKLPELPAYMDKSFAYDATKTMTIEDLLCVSDICISDYSSLIFEYSLFTRPMLFYAYDKDLYDDWRGFYYSYEELTPGPVFTTNEEMVDYIQHVDERFDPKVVEAFREKFMSACDGHATERIMLDTFGAENLEKHKRVQEVQEI